MNAAKLFKYQRFEFFGNYSKINWIENSVYLDLISSKIVSRRSVVLLKLFIRLCVVIY